jgi:hypothetical protein
MKRFLLGISALLLTAAMGFAQPTLKPATFNGHGARLEQVRHRRHKQKHYKNHKKYRHHNYRPHGQA